MRIDYQNVEHKNDFVEITFIGYVPSTGKRKRVVLELDSHDLAQIIDTAKQYRDFQKHIAQKYAERAAAITNAGVTA